MELSLGKRDYARYPFLKEAGELVRLLDLSLYDVTKFLKILDRAKERILQAFKRGKIEQELEDSEDELLSFSLALFLVKAINNEFAIKRYSLAEALRVEAFLNEEFSNNNISIIIYLFKRLFKIEIREFHKDEEFFFEIPFKDYLIRATKFHDESWKLINRPLYHGYVRLKAKDLIRLIREEIALMIEERIKLLKLAKFPEKLKEIVNDLKQKAPHPTLWIGRGEVKDYPPCVKHALKELEEGRNLPHYGRFLLASYMLAIGKGVDEIVGLFSKAPDFKEKITRYQIEHIAGLKGGGTKYRVPSCKTLAEHNFCFKTEECNNIRNPFQFGRKNE
ncbi:MAG: hypothetical protein QXX95_01375 [Nitrososphaerales archaeon]